MNGVSVALDETAREVSERQVLPAGGLRERIEQQRPITALRLTILLLEACNRPIWLIEHRFGRRVANELRRGQRPDRDSPIGRNSRALSGRARCRCSQLTLRRDRTMPPLRCPRSRSRSKTCFRPSGVLNDGRMRAAHCPAVRVTAGRSASGSRSQRRIWSRVGAGSSMSSP